MRELREAVKGDLEQHEASKLFAASFLKLQAVDYPAAFETGNVISVASAADFHEMANCAANALRARGRYECDYKKEIGEIYPAMDC
jgi:hypothetical protein